MGRRPRLKEWFDTELAELPQELRWREWMGRGRGGDIRVA